MEELYCPGCSDKVVSKSIRRFRSDATEIEYLLYHCAHCDLMFWEPRQITPELYSNSGFGYLELHCNLRKKLPFYTMPFFHNFPCNKGLLLDVGGGDGLFAQEAQRRGFDVYLVDFDEKSVGAAHRRGIENAFAYSLNDFTDYCLSRKVSFDAITFFEVIEHQANLHDFIHGIKKLLKPGGWIAGSTPNRDRAFANITRRADGQDTPPHHFFWWNKKSLQIFLHLNGFDADFLVTRVDLETTTANLADFLGGDSIRRIKGFILDPREADLQSGILGHQSGLLTLLKTMRHLCLLPAGIALKLSYDMTGGFSLYFQGKLRA
ncbi:MAG: class I SAM-dependent methyltransferase [Dissulfurispiraceae bacterium]